MRLRAAITCLLTLLVIAGPRTAARQTQSESGQDRIDFEGRVMAWLEASARHSLPGQQEAGHDMLVRRARFVVHGRVSQSIGITLQFGQDNIGARVLRQDGSIRIKDAYINYAATPAVQMAAGQLKVPFLRANLESGFNQILVDRGTLPTLRPAREGSRDLGFMTWGHVNGLQYRLGMFDGSDQEAENSGSKPRYAGRLAYNWFTEETGLGYTASHLGSARVLQIALQFDMQKSRLDASDTLAFRSQPRDYRSYALEGFLEYPFAGGWTVTVDGAWLEREDDYAEPGVPARQLAGYYLQAGLLVPRRIGPGRLQFAGRREDWDTARGVVGSATTRTTGGVTYYLHGHDRKLQIDYTRKRETPAIDDDELRISLVVIFREGP